MLTDCQDERLDRCQLHALRYIFGMGLSYAEMRKRAGVTTLRQRRVEQSDKFAKSCLTSDRFGSWFPKRSTRSSGRVRGTETYLEQFARCERLRNSPVFFMRRRLNGKLGKRYGARNHDRREDGYVGGASTGAWKTGTDSGCR